MRILAVISYIVALLTMGFIAWYIASNFLTDMQSQESNFAGMGLLAVVVVLLFINLVLPWRCFMCSGAIIMMEGLALSAYLIFASQEYLILSFLLLVPGFILFWSGYKNRGLSLYQMTHPSQQISGKD